MATTEDNSFEAFDPGFEHGDIDLRTANIKGTFSAASAEGTGASVRRPNLVQVDSKSFKGLDDSGAVREPNVEQIGDDAFNELLGSVSTPLTLLQVAWRSAIPAFALLPFALVVPAMKISTIAGLVLASLGTVSTTAVACRAPLMVKQGNLAFVQYVENGATHVLQAGMHPIASFGTTMKTFEVKEDQMSLGTVSFVRVRPGFVGLATDNGQPVLLLPGQHLINEPNFALTSFASINSPIISNGPLHIVRVPPSELGLATINKEPLVLDAGLHFIHEPSFEYRGGRSVNDNLIQLGPLSIVRVEPGMLGMATINGKPLLLDGGVHVFNEPSFVMADDGWRRVDEAYLNIGPIHIVTVPRGFIVPVTVNGEGHFLLEGRHFVNQARFRREGRGGPLSEEYMSAGTRHRIVVPRGKLGLALEQGEPVLYEPGTVHLVNSPLFRYVGSVDVTQQVVSHGSLKIVTVKDGQVGITYNNGALELLKTGRHTIGAATHVLAGFVSTGQQTLRISEVTGMSLDNVELKFDAAIAIRVVDARKAVVMLTSGSGDVVREIQENIQERAKLDLSTIVGKNRLNKKHEATATARRGKEQQGADAAADAAGEGGGEDDDSFMQVGVPAADDEAAERGSGFRSAIHDDFMALFKEEMLHECGVEVINMAIEDVVIVDHELARALASAAVANSALERQTIEAEIMQVKAAAEAKVASIDAEGRAAAMKIISQADAERIQTVSRALEASCPAAQQQEVIRASGTALSDKSTVLLAQDMSALAGVMGIRKDM